MKSVSKTSHSTHQEANSEPYCKDCDIYFLDEYHLNKHLLHHVKQPLVLVQRTILAPIKIKLKTRSDKQFEIVSAPALSPLIKDTSITTASTTETKVEAASEEEEEEDEEEDSQDPDMGEGTMEEPENISNVTFSPLFATENTNFTEADDNSNDTEKAENARSPVESNERQPEAHEEEEEVMSEVSSSGYTSIPGAEPTPPPEPSPDYPKIRIKSSGQLMPERQSPQGLTITEITDENPLGDLSSSDRFANANETWPTPSLEDPLRLPDTIESDGSIITNLFTNNNDRAKDLGFTSSDSDFIGMDQLDTRINNALSVYNPNSALVPTSYAHCPQQQSGNALNTLAGLPMQQLAQQVSRLQPNSGNSGQLQQNVLINIQQFPQAPPAQLAPHPHPYGMYGHAPPPVQPMYHQQYQYQHPQPPNHLYFSPAAGYPPQQQQHMPPPPPPGPQMPALQQAPTSGIPQQQHHSIQAQHPPHLLAQPQQGNSTTQQPPPAYPQQQQPHHSQQQQQAQHQQQQAQHQQQQQAAHQQQQQLQQQQQQLAPGQQQPIRQMGPRGGMMGNSPRQQMAGGPRQQMTGGPRQQMAGGPRQQMAGPRQQMGGPRQPMGRGQPQMGGPRFRGNMTRGRGGPPMNVGRGRPRTSVPQMMNGQQQQQQQRVLKRTPEQIQALQAKRKKMDVLLPVKTEDPDCEVISVQPKNSGLPQIQSVQGNVPEPSTNENSVMNLSDSITLSVRQPAPKPALVPQKSDAKEVANILATRGITVTSAPKTANQNVSSKTPPPPVPINLNSSVCIIPNKNSPKKAEPQLATVDLTDEIHVPQPKQTLPTSTQQPPPLASAIPERMLAFKCDLCPAKYPNNVALVKHRQAYHKTGNQTDYGVPLIDLRQPNVMQKLTGFGIYNYIPLPAANMNGMFALPVISMNAVKNNANLGALGNAMLTLGPIRKIQQRPGGQQGQSPQKPA